MSSKMLNILDLSFPQRYVACPQSFRKYELMSPPTYKMFSMFSTEDRLSLSPYRIEIFVDILLLETLFLQIQHFYIYSDFHYNIGS